jgi:hypothetical protein
MEAIDDGPLAGMGKARRLVLKSYPSCNFSAGQQLRPVLNIYPIIFLRMINIRPNQEICCTTAGLRKGKWLDARDSMS